MDALVPLQSLSLPGILGALIVIGIVLVVGRFVLNFALRLVVIAAIIAGILWLLGAFTVIPLFALPVPLL